MTAGFSCMPPRPRLPPLLACTCKRKPAAGRESQSSQAFSTSSIVPPTSAEPFLDFLYPTFGFFSRSLNASTSARPLSYPSSFTAPSSTSLRAAHMGRNRGDTVRRCFCGRAQLTCVHCRPNHTMARPAERLTLESAAARVADLPSSEAREEESVQAPIARETVDDQPDDSIASRRLDKLRASELERERLRAMLQELDHALPPSRVITTRPRASSLRPHVLSVDGALKTLHRFWHSALHVVKTHRPRLKESEKIAIIQTIARIGRAPSPRTPFHPLTDTDVTVTSQSSQQLSSLRRLAGGKMLALLHILRPPEGMKQSIEYASLHLDALALLDELPIIPSFHKTDTAESRAQADLRLMFLESAKTCDVRFRIYQRARLTLSRVLDAWSRSTSGAQQALALIGRWHLEHLFEPFVLSQEEAESFPMVSRRVHALNVRCHGDVLRRSYAELLRQLPPSPSLWLKSQPSTSPSLAAHLIRHLALDHSPLEALAIWDHLRDEEAPIPAGLCTATNAALLEGLRRSHLFEDANRVAATLAPSTRGAPAVNQVIARIAADQGKLGDTVRALSTSTENDTFAVAAARMRAHAEKNETSMVRRIFDQTDRSGASSQDQVRLWGELVRAHARTGDTKSAAQALSDLLAEGLKPSIVLLNSLLSAYATCRDVDRTYQLFHYIREFDASLRPNVASFAALASLHANMLDSDAAERVIRWMESDGLAPNLKIWTTLMACYVETDQPTRALDVFLYLEKCGDIALRPDTAAVNVLIKCFVRSSTPSLSILDFVRQRIASGFRPSIATYNLVLQSLCADGEMDRAEELFSMMEKPGSLPRSMEPVRPDVIIFSNLIYGYLRQDNAKAARACLDEMRVRGLAPTTITYGVIIATFLRGDATMGLKMAVDLAESFIHHSVLRPHSRPRHLDLPLARGEELLHIVGPLIDAYAKRGSRYLAAEYFKLLVNRKAAPSVLIYASMMNACRNDGDAESVWELWHVVHSAILSSYPSPTSTKMVPRVAASHRSDLVTPWTIVVDASEHYPDVLRQWRILAQQGFAFDAANWNSLGSAASIADDLETAFWIGENVLTVKESRTFTFTLPDHLSNTTQGDDETVLSARQTHVRAVRTQKRLYGRRTSPDDPLHAYSQMSVEQIMDAPPSPVPVDSRDILSKARQRHQRFYWTFSAAFLDNLSEAVSRLDQSEYAQARKTALLSAHPRVAAELSRWRPPVYVPWVIRAQRGVA